MRNLLLRWLACFIWLLVPTLAGGATATLPQFTGLVADHAGALDDASQTALMRRLGQFQNSGRAQVAILVAEDTRGLPLSDFSLQVAQEWKLGHAGKDDGLLIVVVPSLKAARLEVGYGLEGVVPDVKAADWIDHVLLPAMRQNDLAGGLATLLDRLDATLPAAAAPPPQTINILDQHPEWKLPFVFAIFSPFALFPLFLGRSGGWVSAPLFAGFMGLASWMLWGSVLATASVAAVAFVLPLLWNLNRRPSKLSPWLAWARSAGNLVAVLSFFSIITVFVGAGLSGNVEEVWAAPLFAGALALGLGVFLFPGRPGEIIGVVLRSYMHFLLILLVAYLALQQFNPHPVRLAFSVAGAFTFVVALSLFLDSLETKRKAQGETVTPWSLWLVGLALLIGFPFGALLLVQAALGADFNTRLAQAAAGGGSMAGVLWWAARQGFFVALTVGLGGKFGGGGAEGRD